jgi:hypothetical protein
MQEKIMRQSKRHDHRNIVNLSEEDRDDRVEEGDLPFADAPATTLEIAVRELADEKERLRREVALLRYRLASIAEDKAASISSSAMALDKTARTQLGEFPWLKLAAAFGAVFVATRLLRRALIEATFVADRKARGF